MKLRIEPRGEGYGPHDEFAELRQEAGGASREIVIRYHPKGQIGKHLPSTLAHEIAHLKYSPVPPESWESPNRAWLYDEIAAVEQAYAWSGDVADYRAQIKLLRGMAREVDISDAEFSEAMRETRREVRVRDM